MTAAALHNDPSQDPGIRDIDHSLVKAIREKNDRAAFTVLIHKYQKPVFRFCYRYFGNEDDAKDMAQDIFVKVFLKIHDFRGDAAFSSWLYRIMVNMCMDKSNSMYYRIFRRKPVPALHREDDPWDHRENLNEVASPEKLLLNKELGEVIRSSVASLDKRQRAILILRDYHDKSYEEIAGAMNMQLGTVKSALCRARKKVAETITTIYRK
jgi:RNA polymerase sigma-70 factor (ECF subfamily)